MDRYQEALERAKQGKPIEEVFPELKESEDEKVRKELVEYFINTGCNYIRGVPIENVIAYLERQKEHKTKIDACGFPLRDKGESASSYLERCLAPDMRGIWYEACAEIKGAVQVQTPAGKLIAEIERTRQEMVDKGEQKGLHDAEIIRRSVISTCEDLLNFAASLQQEQSEAIDGVVHYALGTSWIVTNSEQLHARLKQFTEGAEVEIFIEARKEE